MDITVSQTFTTGKEQDGNQLEDIGPEYIVLMAVMIIPSIIACTGNALTIVVIYKDPGLRTMANMHIASLASADFIGGITGLFEVIWFINEDVTIFLRHSKGLCLLWFALFFISFASSLLSMTLITMDRWLYIAYPLRYYIWITHHKTAFMIGLSWTVAILFGLLPLAINNFDKTGVCDTAIIATRLYLTYGLGIVLFGSCFATFSFYFKIFLIARKQNRSIQTQYGGQDHKRNTYRQIKMSFVICCITFICWVPFYIQNLPETPVLSLLASNFIACLSIMNSCVNFFLYSAKNVTFRKSFLKLFPCINNIANRT